MLQKIVLKDHEWNFSVNLTKNFKIFACDSRQQVEFHAKYPLFDSQSEHKFAFNYAILNIPYHRLMARRRLLFSRFSNLPVDKEKNGIFAIGRNILDKNTFFHKVLVQLKF